MIKSIRLLLNCISQSKKNNSFSMESWSDATVNSAFKVTFYLDTNILSYLIDKTYNELNDCFAFLSSCDLVSLKSSRYVIFELVGIRKREHYLRKILKNNTASNGVINLSSLFLYKESFKTENIDFPAAVADIRAIINRELDHIVNDLKIDFETSELHKGLWKPTFDLLIKSRLSREDSLVTISSVYPQEEKAEDDVCILTNDKLYDEAFYDDETKSAVDGIFVEHSISKPHINHISKLSSSKLIWNLTTPSSGNRGRTVFLNKVKETLESRNSEYFIGKTISVPSAAPTGVMCFELPADKVLNDDKYIVIVGKKLDFIYTTKVRISSYKNNMVPVSCPYSGSSPTRLSVVIKTLDESGNLIDIEPHILEKLTEKGNYLFMHPDE